MSRKSKQHIVPQAYLRSFCDPRPPEGWPEGKPFTASLWVHARGLDAPPKRSAPRNVAWARDVYTLRGDDPEHPWLEEALGRLESAFGTTIDRVTTAGELSVSDRAVLSLFVGALHERTVGILRQRQAFFDDLTDITRQFEDADGHLDRDPDAKAARDAFWRRFGEEAKRQVANTASAFATVTGPHAFLVENDTPMPFVASDSPTTYRQIHADELVEIGMPQEWFYREIPRGAREFFVFCPLSPTHGYVASRFFPPQVQMLRRATSSVQLVYALNEFTRDSADEQLFASSRAPYGPLLQFAHRRDQLLREAQERPRSGLSVHSRRDRYWLPTVNVMQGNGDHPLTGRLTFTTDDLATLKAMAADNDFVEIVVVEHGVEMGGMREASFVSVGLDPEAGSVIENGPLRPMPVHSGA